MSATTTIDRPPRKPAVDSVRIGRAAFRHLLNRHGGWSVDELLLHPNQALAISRLTCQELAINRTASEVLRALMNCRKRGELRK